MQDGSTGGAQICAEEEHLLAKLVEAEIPD